MNRRTSRHYVSPTTRGKPRYMTHNGEEASVFEVISEKDLETVVGGHLFPIPSRWWRPLPGDGSFIYFRPVGTLGHIDAPPEVDGAMEV